MTTTLDIIAGAVLDPTADGIARGIGRLVSNRELAPGERLPTVRQIAYTLDVSPTTVGDAWQILRRHRVIETRGRRGSFIRDDDGTPSVRYWQVPSAGSSIDIDLGSGVPDAALLPGLSEIMATIDHAPAVGSYLEPPVLPELENWLLTHWPFPPERLTILNGALDAFDRLIASAVSVGDVVGVSEPGFPPIYDMLELAGAELIPIPLDSEGLDTAAIRSAAVAGMTLLVTQPRAHNPTGVSMSVERRDAIAAELADRNVLVIEDEHIGDCSSVPLHSLGSVLPSQVVHVHSFSKSHGPDLRIAAVGGAAAPIEDVERRRLLGPSWTSRILQEVLLAMLTSPHIAEKTAEAGAIYARRRSTMVDLLADRGIVIGGNDGLNIWVPVDDEAVAVPMLASHGIGVARGRPFHIDAPDEDHIRVTTAMIDEDEERIADLIADAARGYDTDQNRNGGRR